MQSVGTLHWPGRPSPNRGASGKFDPIEGVIIHEEVAELPSAAEEPQRAASSSIAGEAYNACDLRLDAALAALGRLSPVGPEGIGKYP